MKTYGKSDAAAKSFGRGVAAYGLSERLTDIPPLHGLDRVAKVSVPHKSRKKERPGSLKALAEAVILQSVEDLWSRTHRKASIEFFAGEGFNRYADLAEMKVVDRLRLIGMLKNVNEGMPKKKGRGKAAA